MLTKADTAIGDNLNYPFVLLANQLKSLGHRVATIDTDDLHKFDAIVFVEFPGKNNKYFKTLVNSNFKNIYLILLESVLVKPDNYIKENHGYFKKIFTWQDELIDNKKYIKIQYSHHIPTEFNFKLEKEALCAMIASNKSSNYPNELYSERKHAVQWFEKNHPQDFHLYGEGWDKYNFEGKFLGIKIARLNRLHFLTKLLAPHYPSYKGPVLSKNQTYQKYKFSICYENIKNIPGYITEKIFDCFLAGCVPIYLGAQNITNYIPQNTFIDKRNFETYEKLYTYLKHMPNQEYAGYVNNIVAFLKSDKAQLFSAQCFADTIIDLLLKDFRSEPQDFLK